jgi:hypothetical protein
MGFNGEKTWRCTLPAQSHLVTAPLHGTKLLVCSSHLNIGAEGQPERSAPELQHRSTSNHNTQNYTICFVARHHSHPLDAGVSSISPVPPSPLSSPASLPLTPQTFWVYPVSLCHSVVWNIPQTQATVVRQTSYSTYKGVCVMIDKPSANMPVPNRRPVLIPQQSLRNSYLSQEY